MAKTTNYVSDGLRIDYSPEHPDLVNIVNPKIEGAMITVLPEEIDGLIAELRAVQHCWQYQKQQAQDQAAYERWVAGQPTPTEAVTK